MSSLVRRSGLESLLRSRGLAPHLLKIKSIIGERKGRCGVASTLPLPFRDLDPQVSQQDFASTGISQLDRLLGGGFQRGSISEIVGGRSSGKSSLLLSALAYATAREEIVALVDVEDKLDPASAAGAGVELHRLLWIQCAGAMEKGLRAAELVAQAGGFGVVGLDLGDPSPKALGKISSHIWFRLLRGIEGTSTALILVGPRHVAGSSSAATVSMRLRRALWSGKREGATLLRSLEVEAKLLRGGRVVRSESTGLIFHRELVPPRSVDDAWRKVTEDGLRASTLDSLETRSPGRRLRS